MPQTLILRPRYLNGGLGQTAPMTGTVTIKFQFRDMQDLVNIRNAEGSLATVMSKFEELPEGSSKLEFPRDSSGMITFVPGEYTSIVKYKYKDGVSGDFAADLSNLAATFRRIGLPIVSASSAVNNAGSGTGAGSGSGSGGQSADNLDPANEKNEPKKDGDKWGAYLEMAKPYALPAAITLLALVLIFKSNGRR